MKPYNIRLDPKDMQQLSSLGGTRSEHIRKAIQIYLQDDTQKVYDRNVVAILNNHIEDLKHDKEILQQRLDYWMLPWFHRLLLPKLEDGSRTKK